MSACLSVFLYCMSLCWNALRRNITIEIYRERQTDRKRDRRTDTDTESEIHKERQKKRISSTERDMLRDI